MTSRICLSMLIFLRWASLSYGLPPLHFACHSLRYVANFEAVSALRE